MRQLTAEQFAQRVFDVDLLDEHQLRAVWAELGTSNATAEAFQQQLLRHGLLTNYQIERVMRGERTGFFYGDYRVLYQVGSGAFARAYRAVHKDTSEVVAIKALRRRYAHDPEVTGQFVREGAVGNLLRHPNIVPIYEVVSKGETHYLVMEFLEGQTLRRFLKIHKRFDPPQAIDLMCDIASGLNYAHERGITHRDLKTSNVLVTSTGQAKLVDFGLAAVAHNAAMGTVEEGPNPRTIDYVGLERITHVRKNDPRSDIYFAGCMLYNMLVGRPPLRETLDRIQRLSVSRYTDVVPITAVAPTLPPWIVRIVERGMEMDVARRYQTPGEMLADLKRAKARLVDPQRFGDANGQAGGDMAAPTGKTGSGFDVPVARPKHRKTVMVVESNAMMQDIFRQAFHDTGYHVLVTSDPLRALEFFAEDRNAAQCLVFCSADLGQPAVEAFNRFAEDPGVEHVPAVLLLGKDQTAWQSQVKQAPHRVAVASPMRVRQLREMVARLVPPDDAA